MNQREIQAVAGILDAFTCVDDFSASRQRMLDELCKLGDLRGGHLLNLDTYYESNAWENLSSGDGLDNPKFDIDLSHYSHHCPIADFQKTRGPEGAVFRHGDVLGENNWTESEFCHDFTRRYDMLDGVIMLLHGPGGKLRWGFGGGHSKKGGVKKSYLSILRVLAPVLSRAMCRLEKWHGFIEAHGSATQIIDSVRDAVALVRPANKERGARLLTATPPALAAFGAHGSATTSNPVMRSFLEAAPFAVGAAVPWTDCRGRQCLISGIRSSQTTRDADTILLRIEAIPVSAPSIDAEGLAKTRLSLREFKVLDGASRGLADKEIGRELGISVHTARAHLRNVYAKLGVAGRIEAINEIRRRLK